MAAPEAKGSTLEPNCFRQEGEYWTLGYEGTVVRLRDSKGMAALAFLLARPGERVAAALVLGADEAGPETAATAEQSRVMVTKRIKAALMKIRQHHPSLGHHLTTCIKTGHLCTYTPNPKQPVHWILRMR
jgi:hypothetical protein